MTIIYCISTTEKWHQAQAEGVYLDQSLDAEGFIHCSYPHQLLRVVNKHFKGMANLVILCINRDQLTCEAIDEDLSGLNENYPHIYGPINIEAVVEVVQLPIDRHGNFNLPVEIP